MTAKKTSHKKKSSSDAAPNAEQKVQDSYAKNAARMQPGHVETDETTGQRVIHPAANPQQVNPIHDDEHETAAVREAKVLTAKDSTHAEKMEATAVSNLAEGAPAAETNPHLPGK